MIDWLFRFFQKPWILIFVMPAIALLYYFVFKYNLIKLDLNDKRLKHKRVVIFITRSLIFILLLVALAGPFVENYRAVYGDPKIKLLIDNSTSMNVFDTNIIDNFRKELNNEIPVEVAYIGVGESSALGDNILSNMKRNENLLLITDGYSNEGVGLGDIALRASNFNTTISAVKLNAKNHDASVAVLGSEKTIADVENEYTVEIKQSKPQIVDLIVKVDGEVVINTKTSQDKIKFKKNFKEGYHSIEGKINADDYFDQNNIFYKTVKVVPKSKILIFSKSGLDLNNLFEPLYATVLTSEMPVNLDDYYAVVVDNMPASTMDKYANKLTNFVADGGGMLVIGGGNSYDAGGYKGSRFEQLLPVFVSKAGKKVGDTYIILVIDISGSTGHFFGDYVKADIEKAIAVDMLQNLSLVNKIGVAAFNQRAYKVVDVKTLLEHKDLNETIAALRYSGGTYISSGLLLGMQMLEGKGGSKNIILISDGRNQDDEEAKTAASSAYSKGIRIYTIGVGEDTDNENMIELAGLTGGTYFKVGETDRVRVLFGNNEKIGDKRVFPLVVLDSNHFVTDGLKLNGNVYGFNQVVPKTSGKLLVSDDVGDPLVAVSRLGLGRVASLATDYNLWGFELLNKGNSLLLTRLANWAIGDPERRNEKFISVSDGRLGEEIEIIVKSDVQPYSSDVALYKFDEDLYRGILVINEVGFKKILDSQFAVDYKKEYQGIGFNSDLENIAAVTNGKIFNIEDLNSIVEFVKLRSKIYTVAKKDYSWIFALMALLIFLGEITYRRIYK